MYTLTQFIEQIVRTLPDVSLESDISALSDEYKKVINEELLKVSGLVDGWFLWGNDLFTYNAEANIIRKIDYVDTSSYYVPSSNDLLSKPIILLQSSNISSVAAYTVPDVNADTLEWQLSDSPTFKNPTIFTLDKHNIGPLLNTLESGNSYYLRVRQNNTTDTSEWSEAIHILTLRPPKRLQPILTVSDVDEVEWDITDITNDTNTYELKNIVLDQLEPDREYIIKGRIRYPDGTYSNMLELKTIKIIPNISAPYIVVEHILGNTYATLSKLVHRTDFTDTINTVEILYTKDPNWSVSTTASFTYTTDNRYALLNLDTNSIYYIKARYSSFNSTVSRWSNTVKTYMGNSPPVSAAIILTNVIDTSSTPNQVVLTTTTPIIADSNTRIEAVVMDIISDDHNFTLVKTPPDTNGTYRIDIGTGSNDIHPNTDYTILVWYVGYIDSTDKPQLPSSVTTLTELWQYDVSYLNTSTLPYKLKS